MPQNPWVRLVLTWCMMLVLVGITVGVAVIFPHIGIWHSAINLLIAGILIFLVMSFYMHLDSSPGLLRLMAGTGFFWLIFMFTLGLADYFSRIPPP
ncbi:MAG TPA: cytochrome C oxidase subunit IV family protein [Gammaproteobacteria bacterium]|nr:cytochrome C oxidase subunit IV family protein [Gammaproteobacteria bacterium]